MIDGLRPYSEYKESGQLWLGSVPRHWSLLPNRATFVEIKDRNHGDEQMLSVTITRGVVPQSELLANTAKKDSSRDDKSAYKLVQRGDIAYNKMRAWQGAIAASDFRGIVSPAYIVMRLRDEENTHYFHYLYRTPQFAKEAERWSYGITSDMWSLRPEHFRMIYSTLPPRSEQDAIVRFLDHINRRIERAIRAKKKLIALLNEQKQVIIHQTVTRGLDRSVSLEGSGIPWLGEIPSYWELKSLGSLATYISYGFTNPMPATDEGPFMLTAKDISGGTIQYATARHTSLDAFRSLLSDKSRPRLGDLLITKDGTLGRVAIANEKQVCINQSVALLRLSNNGVCREFVAEALQAAGYQEMMAFNAGGTTIKHIYISRLAKMKMAMPPVEEQRKIAAFVKETRARFERAIETAEQGITLLSEYRMRLGADVVTGKLDVREAARNLPEEVPETISALEGKESAELETEEVEA